MDIETRKDRLDQRINTAAQRAGRDPSTIRLLAVSKRQSTQSIRDLAGFGQLAFGENYLQEAVDKICALSDLELEWHFIGQLQRNKTRVVAEHFDWVQSIDRAVLAERLSAQRPAGKADLNLCIQVRMSEEAGKGGISNDEIFPLADIIDKLPRVNLRGLMTIPENTSNVEKQRQSFSRMYAIFSDLKSRFPTVDTLSMGMSGDFELAIEEGSTMIRIGSALFGPRPTD